MQFLALLQRLTLSRSRQRVALAAIFVFVCLGQVAAQEPAAQPLSLSDAITLALAHHPALQAAGGQVAAAEARAGEAHAAEGTQVRVDSRYSLASKVASFQITPLAPPVQLGSKATWLTTFSAQQVLYSGGRLQALVRQASDLAHAAEANRQRTRQQVVYQATRAFETLVAAQRQRGVAQQALDAANAHLHDAQLRVEARPAAKFDVLRAQVDVDTARQQVISADTDLQVAEDALLQALGLQHGNYTAIETPPAASAPLPPVDQLLTQAYARRPELRAFDFQLAAATSAITAARRQHSPTFSLGANYQIASPSSPIQFTEWTLALQAGLPLLDAGLMKASVREAEAQRTQTVAARAELLNSVTAEVCDAYARLASAGAQVEVTNAQVGEAEEAMRIARVRYQGGVGTATEVADTQATLTRTRQGLLQAQANLAIARATLDFATGADQETAP